MYTADLEDIAVMGFSAGGIHAGEFLIHYDEDINGTALDIGYVPDELDTVPHTPSAAGLIYSFYGRPQRREHGPGMARRRRPATYLLCVRYGGSIL